MILHCDEDVGAGIPHALKDVGLDVRAHHKVGWSGQPDTVWLPRAGQLEWLVYSHNKKMLTVPLEKLAIVNGNVGIIFLTSGEENTVNQLRLLLNRWDTLELLWKTTPTPMDK